ncbi:IclR family transcriptional regulator domain-containing protein [Ferrovibrio sp.]|uniref:IclR family transcriptional regulator domain-containing protein n=1 Tax=Ferrovibrio sp. TaxID=1917215 RepID=UPI003D1133E7
MPSFKPVIALTRGLEILRVLNEQQQTSVGALHKATGLDKATIVRMLETLEHEGYVMRDAERALYAPTGRVLVLSQGYDQHLWIGSVADPFLQDFRKQIGWPSDVALFDRDAMIVVQTTREPGSMLLSRKPGFRFPLLATSLGRAYLAFLPEEQREAVIGQLAKNPEHWNDLARNRKKLNRLLSDTRSRGFAFTDDAYSREVFNDAMWAIGAPIMQGEQVFASINIMMLRRAVAVEDGIKQFAEPLRQTAARIAKALVTMKGGKA